jgi:hypothetical protein
MDYRDVLATVVGASVAGIVAFFIRLVFPVNAAVLALIYAATYSLLWSIVGDHSRQLFHKHLPASTRFDGHWRLVTGGLALAAALCAGLIVAFALSRSTTIGNSSTGVSTSIVTRTLALQPRVVVTRKTIVLPVKTTIVTTPITGQTVVSGPNQGTSTVFSHTVVVVRPPVTVTVSSTRSQTATVTQTTPTVTTPAVTTVVTTPPTTVTAPTTSTDATGTTTATDTVPSQ